jgi:hypothetical protein
MWKHLRTVHFPWSCESVGCSAIFANKDELHAHQVFESH